ncbi:cytochrome b involved in lipid metabolism [Thioflavicoccus mobilis 8321]|uniref:Cytochrome b involved in lipid metabolism n=1 Tax=Thioflavicoccus mobilis 8321 TaxID=765912 RepID=L0GUJ2_9GAMM|nr:cytochrome b5-like heme/steroid binding domain-containing protein [Thioflavicoccus mobilis]AGA89671.1 cytochrome b involved in lipid metabolism [Thioflavicoccus mobilis 8321]
MKSAVHSTRSTSVALLALAALLGTGTVTADDAPLPTYTLDDIAAHASPTSCWMAIDGEVYDVTEHIAIHPTQPEVIGEWCGKEASEAWRTKGYGQEHSPVAHEMLEEIHIGTLAQ